MLDYRTKTTLIDLVSKEEIIKVKGFRDLSINRRPKTGIVEGYRIADPGKGSRIIACLVENGSTVFSIQ